MNPKIHKKVNKLIVSTINTRIPNNTCTGCTKSFCCTNQKAIDVSYVEFELLKPHITDAVMKRATTEITKHHLMDRYTCPFLEHGRCMVYDVRPTVCAAHTVISPVEDCDTSIDSDTLIVNKIGILASLVKKYKWFNKHLFKSVDLGSSHMIIHFEKIIKGKNNE